MAAVPHRIPLIRGNTKERDTLPFQTNTGSQTTANGYYFTVDQATALRWCWLVKTWKLNGSFKVEMNGDDVLAYTGPPPTPLPSFNVQLNVQFTDYEIQVGTRPFFEPAAEERQILDYFNRPVVGPTGFRNGNSGAQFHGTGTVSYTHSITGTGGQPAGYTYTWDGQTPTFTFRINTFEVYWQAGVGFQIFMEFAATVRGDFSSHWTGRVPNDESSFFILHMWGVTAIGDLPTPEPFTSWINTGKTMNVDGHTLQVWSNARSDNDGGMLVTNSDNVHGVILTATDWTVTPSEFFPFLTKTSAPVWDTASGAQVNDPFS